MYEVGGESLKEYARIFAVAKYEILIITGSSSPMSGRLGRLETVTEVRVCPEDSAIERGASLKTEVLTTSAVRPAPCILSVSTEPILCSL